MKASRIILKREVPQREVPGSHKNSIKKCIESLPRRPLSVVDIDITHPCNGLDCFLPVADGDFLIAAQGVFADRDIAHRCGRGDRVVVQRICEIKSNVSVAGLQIEGIRACVFKINIPIAGGYSDGFSGAV